MQSIRRYVSSVHIAKLKPLPLAVAVIVPVAASYNINIVKAYTRQHNTTHSLQKDFWDTGPNSSGTIAFSHYCVTTNWTNNPALSNYTNKVRLLSLVRLDHHARLGSLVPFRRLASSEKVKLGRWKPFRYCPNAPIFLNQAISFTGVLRVNSAN